MNAKLDDLAVLDEKGTLNDQGLGLLANLLEHLPRVHEGRWKEAFVPMVSKLVRVCVDLAVIRGHKVLMKWRDDEFFKGWECPGGSLGPGESWKDAAERFGQKEFGIKVCFLGKLETFNNTDNPRAQDVTVLLLWNILVPNLKSFLLLMRLQKGIPRLWGGGDSPEANVRLFFQKS